MANPASYTFYTADSATYSLGPWGRPNAVAVWFKACSSDYLGTTGTASKNAEIVATAGWSLGQYDEYQSYSGTGSNSYSIIIPSSMTTFPASSTAVVRIDGTVYNTTSTKVTYPTITLVLLDADLNEITRSTVDWQNLVASTYPLRYLRIVAASANDYGNDSWTAYVMCGSSTGTSTTTAAVNVATGVQEVLDSFVEQSEHGAICFYGMDCTVNCNSTIFYKPYKYTLYFTTDFVANTGDIEVTDEEGNEVEPDDSGTIGESTESDATDSETSSTLSDVSGYDADSDGGYQGYYQSIYDYMAVAHPNTENWTSVHSADSSVGARTVTLTEDNYTEYLETWQVNALPLRCYNLIYKEWFRDENLIDSPPINKDDGVDDGTDYKLLKRAKRHDYFTAALPWTQKGDIVDITSVLSATGDAADIGLAINATDASAVSAGSDTLGSIGFLLRSDTYSQAGGVTPDDGTYDLNAYPTTTISATTPDGTSKVLGVADTVYANTQLQLTGESIANILAQSVVTSFSINELREAFQIQRLLERDARSGTRYTEILRGHFGVISPDARLQRPEYLGGSTTMLNINTVAQTSSTDDTSPQGNLSAYGVMASKHNGFNKSFVEHGYIIGLVSIRADLTYQQGLHKLWTRQTRYDFYWPVLAHLGEQAVYNREIYFQNDADADETVFGYQERWSEYRYFPSQITGLFRSSYKETLDFWHLSQYFEECPKLNQDFIEENVPIERVIAVTSEPHFLLDVWFRSRTTRPMPTYSVPGLIDHF